MHRRILARWRLGRGDTVYLTAGLRIYPGTTLQRIAVGEGVIAPDDPLLVPRFYFSPALEWDAAAEKFPGSPKANELLHYKYRAPYKLS